MKKHYLVKTVILLVVFLTASTALALDFPGVVVKDQKTGQHKPLRMTELKIDINVVANLATTTMTMNFYNDLDRILEGTLYFPLGEGQTVSRFAMDVNGKLREGVVVEKAKGRQVFEKIVRQQIDPGLLEWTKGNSFKSRIYPIPAKGNKKIVIAYEQELTDAGNGFLYALPLQFKDRVDLFEVRAEVFKQDVKPDLSNSELENFSFKKWRESYIAETKLKNYLPDQQIAFVLPKEKNRQRIFIEADNKENYFYINIDPVIKEAGKKLPDNICLVWDVSGSAASKDIEKELSVLEGYFKKIRKISVKVVLLRNSVEDGPKFVIKKGKIQKLADYLKNLDYDGGTQLGALDLNRYTCDEFILSTDGLSNFVESEIKLSNTPVVILSSSQQADHSYLKYAAQSTCGEYLNLSTVSSREAVKALLSQPYSFINASYNNGSISETYPSVSEPVYRDFSIAGKLLKNKAEITMNFGFGSKVKYSKKIILDKNEHKTDSKLIKRIWAQKKIAELDMMYEKNEQKLTALGKEFSIVTRNTSLIILDRIEDYVTNRIVPPEELRDQYFSLLEQQGKRDAVSEKNHIDDVVRKFKAQQEWWNREFDPDKCQPIKTVKAEGNGGELAADEEDTITLTDAVSEPVLTEEASGMIDFNGLDLEVNVMPQEAPAPMARENISRMATRTGKKAMGPGITPAGAITLAKWDPKTPYLEKIRKSKKSEWYNTYLDQKKEYANSSAFYLDMADFFIEKKMPDYALRILSNIAEMELENHQLLRILGHRLIQLGYYKEAIYVFKEVLKIREEEPQSYRDLGLAYSKDKQFQKAIDMLYDVVRKRWDSRFPEIELIALHEMNAIIATCDEQLNLRVIDERLLVNLPVDIRVVLDWDADNTDMDLWIIDPKKEKCYYSHPKTCIGGYMSRDFTGGYGPEEFMLKNAMPGKYVIKVNYYGNRQQVLAGATTIQVLLTTGFGTENKKNKAITMRLKDQKEIVDVGEFEFKAQ